ncbi:hypothetical protein GCM10022223_17080 [Kineosporia mesophila]|uniref:CdiI immunity protein domain-containing protein n=1 Tax=Kineosporia mesophila TaxID=566012 RepID=A0ABP6Z925_9ACTN|nr:hypothetical protein [Kineosporia mesophila]MCD5352053.1 hypothetical protein [Kineosporia mesophila]
MTTDPDIKVFLDFSAGAMNVNGLVRNWEAEFVEEIESLKIESLKTSFRRGFAKGLSGQISISEYERETGWSFDTPEELHDHLRALWSRFYRDADPQEQVR